MRYILSGVLCLLISIQMIGQEWETPEVKDYGKIKYFKEAAVQPDTSLTYKMVFDIKSEKQKEGVNVGLWKIARTLNLLKAGGVSNDKIDIVAVIHGGATVITLDNQNYSRLKEKDNPNIEILKLLTQKGVDIFVCGQALAERELKQGQMNEYVQFALSALTVLPNYQLQGYVLIP